MERQNANLQMRQERRAAGGIVGPILHAGNSRGGHAAFSAAVQGCGWHAAGQVSGVVGCRGSAAPVDLLWACTWVSQGWFVVCTW